MGKCAYCGSVMFFGVKHGNRHFCNEACRKNSVVVPVIQRIPPDVLEDAVRKLHAGNCPKCRGPGPVDVHTSHRVWSALVVTKYSTQSQTCCSSCAWKAKLFDSLFCLLLGWWGIPFGLLYTPVQIGRNLFGLASGPDPSQPSEAFKEWVCLYLAETALHRQRLAQLSAAPKTA